MKRTTIHQIKIFYGYQFVSENIKGNILEELIFSSCSEAEEKISQINGNDYVKLCPNKYELENTYTIYDSLFKKIENSDICIFEISDKNPNVFLEMGYAKGMNKYVIPLINQELLKEVPSNISGLVTVAYNKLDPKSCKGDLIIQIQNGVEQITSNRKQAKFFWGSALDNHVNVHIGRDKSRRQINMSDLITFNVLKMNFEIPNNLNLILSDEVSGNDFTKNIISLCGPKHNKYFDYIIGEYNKYKRFLFLQVKDAKVNLPKHYNLNEKDYIIQDNTDNKLYISDLEKKYSNEKRTGTTYALIYKIKNKGREKSNYFLFAGINFEGTISSVEAIFDKEFISKLGSTISFQDSSIELLLKFEILNGTKSGIELIQINVF